MSLQSACTRGITLGCSKTLLSLRDLGNTLIVVEHDEETMRASDYIVDLGPGAGVHGGHIVAADRPDALMQDPNSLTAAYLRGERKIDVPETRRSGNGKLLKIVGATEHNLQNVDVDIPLGTLTCITGASRLGQVHAGSPHPPRELSQAALPR